MATLYIGCTKDQLLNVRETPKLVKRQALGCVIPHSSCRDEFTQPKAHLFLIPVWGGDHGCQIAIARFLSCMWLALRASGLWLRYAAGLP